MTANLPDSAPQPTPPAPELATRLRNLAIAMVAIVLSTALFFGLQTGSDSGSLAAMAATATP
ncbi:MAG TPA: thiol:disulfide interchange protein, partial [Coleofasciculaceae cyanobacterium]